MASTLYIPSRSSNRTGESRNQGDIPVGAEAVELPKLDTCLNGNSGTRVARVISRPGRLELVRVGNILHVVGENLEGPRRKGPAGKIMSRVLDDEADILSGGKSNGGDYMFDRLDRYRVQRDATLIARDTGTRVV